MSTCHFTRAGLTDEPTLCGAPGKVGDAFTDLPKLVDCPDCRAEFGAGPATPKGEYGSPAHVLEEQRRTLEQVEAIRRELAGVVEFVEVIKNIGAQAAKGGGMQAMMLRNMVPGIEQLGGQ